MLRWYCSSCFNIVFCFLYMLHSSCVVFFILIFLSLELFFVLDKRILDVTMCFFSFTILSLLRIATKPIFSFPFFFIYTPPSSFSSFSIFLIFPLSSSFPLFFSSTLLPRHFPSLLSYLFMMFFFLGLWKNLLRIFPFLACSEHFVISIPFLLFLYLFAALFFFVSTRFFWISWLMDMWFI